MSGRQAQQHSARVEEVRGVNCESVLTNLELRDLIAEVGRGTGPGLPRLYGTTMRFLQVMGLESLDHLPVPRLDGTEVGPSPKNPLTTS